MILFYFDASTNLDILASGNAMNYSKEANFPEVTIHAARGE
jgi:hypothetical protein